MLDNQISPKTQAIISNLFQDAKLDKLRVTKVLPKIIFRALQPEDMKNVYMPISQEQGEFFYRMILQHQFQSIVEFGTSFGISTLFLAAATQQTNGKVTTTELIENKAEVAKLNFKKAGLENYIDLRVGDAMKTLGNFNKPIDFLMLDGWKNLYLPLFKKLAPSFHKNTLIYADNIDMADSQPFMNYIHNRPESYQLQKMHHGKGALIKLL